MYNPKAEAWEFINKENNTKLDVSRITIEQ
jgi:hypothetical protein